MSRDDTPRSFSKMYRLYLGIAVLTAVTIGVVFLQMDGDGATIMSDKPPIPKTKVEMTENKIIKQKALNLDASLNLSTAHNEIVAAGEE